jgi:proline iminopeptidase
LYINTHRRSELAGKAYGIYQPVLLIAGRYDFLAPLNYFHTLHKLLPDSQLIIFNRSIHVAHIEEKKKFIATLQNFFK